ncbi:MAG: ABC transporter ATP-binding protein [Candidatus Eremiobacteraeota bacterium]|nr:ABC transporter ATP-binding protein [Candidatus Eremiobacteraeota bacterium]
MSGAAVRFEHVGVRYPSADRDSVHDFSLEIAPGELVVVLGPSGSAKSTLLRTVNRLVEPTSGTIVIDARDSREVEQTALRRRIGYVIQAVGLFPHMTVADNVAIVPELLEWEPARIASRVDELLRLVRLDPGRYRDRLPRELSGGEAQRVGVARALAAEPPLLLMDEPFGAVDPVVRIELQDETSRIHRALGKTILFVTHDVDEALRLADRLVIMRDGVLVQAARPLEALAHPADDGVARLIGAADAMRKLSLIAVAAALQPLRDGVPSATIPEDATLRDALIALLESSNDRLRVTARDTGGGTDEIGTISFDDIRRALTTL